jgi:integrase
MPRPRTGYVYYDKGRKSWTARLTYVDAGGKVRNVRRQVGNKTEGNVLLKQLLRRLEDAGDGILDGDKMTFRKLASVYAERELQPPVYRDGKRLAGKVSYKDLRHKLRVLVERFGARRIKTITHSDIEKFRDERLATKTRFDRERSVAHVNRELALLRAVFNFARRQGWITRSPFETGGPLISVASENRRERILSREEEERLLVACAGRRAHVRPILIAALDTGARRGELLKLTWADVNLATGLITLRSEKGKVARSRTVGMTARLRAELERLRAIAPPGEGGLVFGIKDNFYNALWSACEEAGVEEFTFHDTRHTATTRMIQSGMPAMEVMKITGHTQPTTFARYVNTDGQAAKRAAAALDGWRAAEDGMLNTELIN